MNWIVTQKKSAYNLLDMEIHPKTEALEEAIREVLREDLQAVSSSLIKDWEGEIEEAISDAARFAAGFTGQPEIREANLDHIRNQARLLASLICIDKEQEVREILSKDLATCYRVLGKSILESFLG
jgi:hypothetical protein